MIKEWFTLLVDNILYVISKPLRKQTFSNILKILPPKKKKIKSDKNSDIFHISVQKHRLLGTR